MISNEKKMEFIHYRSQGEPFDKISKAIGVSKPTLIKLAREFTDEINELEEVYIKELQERFKLSFKKQLSLIHKRLEPIQKKLSECTFHTLGAKDLIDLEIKYLKRSVPGSCSICENKSCSLEFTQESLYLRTLRESHRTERSMLS